MVALYGLFSGSFVFLSPSILVALSPDRVVVGTRRRMWFSVIGAALLIGTPIGGAILDSHGFSTVWIYGGIKAPAGGIVLGIARGCEAR